MASTPKPVTDVCRCIRNLSHWDTLLRGTNRNGWGETRCLVCGKHIAWGVTAGRIPVGIPG